MTFRNSPYPSVAVIQQKLHHDPLSQLEKRITTSLARLSLETRTRKGESIGLAVGSRGIHRIDEVTRFCIQFLSGIGLRPFIVPAMGSHGGATPEGQIEVLAKLGITEGSAGVPIRGSMATGIIGKTNSGMAIPFSKTALEADHLMVINRIKPHTKFESDIESGLCKMLTVGLGKAVGAATYHRQAVQESFGIIQESAAVILQKCPILCGLGLLEDGSGNLSHIEPVLPETWIEQERVLLQQAYSNAARIPFSHIDILIIDTIGKDISGIGMDSKVTGRHRDITGDFRIAPHVKRIFARDLSAHSDGNGNGIGLADFTTDRLVAAIDFHKTYTNALTAISPEKASIPVHFANDRLVMEACAQSIGMETLHQARIVRIKNTASLGTLQVSRPLANEIETNQSLRLLTPWDALEFDRHDNLLPFNG